jgi:hypothetical protein
MAEPKTKKTTASVEQFILSIDDEQRRDDCFAVLEIMKSITKSEPAMWGPSIVGFGSYTYIYASGKSGDWPVAAFSPRKQNLTLYLTPGFEKYPQMKKLGKYKASKGCLYLKSLNDVHLPTLEQLIKASVVAVKKTTVTGKKAAHK